VKVDIFNTENKYRIIYADPPWSYSDKRCNGACEKHYPTMRIDDICALPVKNITDRDAVMFLWATYPQMPAALRLVEAWGFTYKSIAFQWIKLNKSVQKDNPQIASAHDILKSSCFFGLGRWTRGNSECCLIAVKGKPHRASAGVGQLIFAPVTRHSAKPPETRDKIIRLMGDSGSRIELFARDAAAGWDCWGNEV
jgi:N6-adenosine-specific RNA methylase IME4